MSRSSKRPPSAPTSTPTRIVNVEDVRAMQKDARKAGSSELERAQAELEAARFALHRESEKRKDLEARLEVAKQAVYHRHQRIAELEGKLKSVGVELRKAEEAVRLFAERVTALTKPE